MGYRRILLKLSGEALMGEATHGIDAGIVGRLAAEIHEQAARGVQIGLVVGGGNILRGAGLASGGMNRVTGDHMGMLATVINALALQDALEQAGTTCHVMSALAMPQVCESYTARAATAHMEAGHAVIFAAGTGNPFFTTDSAASLRAIEIGADIMLKATKVNGVYSADPLKDPEARFFESISYDEALDRRLGVMDATALVLCRDHDMPLRVFNVLEQGLLSGVVAGEPIGTFVGRE